MGKERSTTVSIGDGGTGAFQKGCHKCGQVYFISIGHNCPYEHQVGYTIDKETALILAIDRLTKAIEILSAKIAYQNKTGAN